jgi:eukaryotic-like serine/threonine-protein kinase
MAVRRPEGAALLVAGHGTPRVTALDASAVHTLGQVGEALLATGTPWTIRRLTAVTGDRYAADRRTIKRALVELANEPVRVAMVVLLGQIIEVAGELALVTGEEAREYPEDATLPLSYIRDRLAAAQAEQMIVAVSARGDGGPPRWLGALGTERTQHVIAIDAPEQGNPLVEALLAGLCGEAVDPRTGTVTLASLSTHLASHAQTVQPSTASETFAQPPPLAGLWDVRRSQLARRRSAAPRATDDDLTGSVLPGRFRLDAELARGTFGTVYRARQLAVERDVAVKVLNGDIDPGSEDGRLFVHEIRSVGRIDHPNVVRIHQADITIDGRLFFAMELLDGRDLETLGGEAGPLPQDRAIELVRQLLDGLGAAHDAGLVHADIKPANAIVVQRKDGDDVAERVVLVDFGLSRLRQPDRAADSAGGTPAYMAPEQREGRVDLRSDLYAAALVLVFLLTGWRRTNFAEMEPPLDKLIADRALREVLARVLHPEPARRFPSARDFAAALAGNAVPAEAEVAARPPFRQLAPFTEDDRDRLHGRATELALVTEHALYRRAVIYTAPSGTGKTSLLRAGLMPRLEALGIHAIYHRCRSDSLAALAAAIDPEVVRRPDTTGAAQLAAAITSFHEHRGGKLVLVIDQLEAAVDEPELVPALLGFERWPRGADVSVVLSIREDYLARLVARTQGVDPNIQILRLPPLAPEGARAAIELPLAEARAAIEPELLDTLLGDLQRAAAAIGPEMGWSSAPAVFPPHLQLACSVLYEALTPGEVKLALHHYRQLGGFDAIVGEHLDRVLESELPEGHEPVARDVFAALVTAANERAIRPDSELRAIAGAGRPTADIDAVLEILRTRGLIVPVRGDGGEPSWELVHDSLVPRVLAWIDRKDLARRRAMELVRHHLRRSSADNPSLLTRRELRELAPHPRALDDLDAEWAARDPATTHGWTPSRLVAHSRATIRHRAIAVTSVVGIALAVGGVGFTRWQIERQRARAEASLRERDLGRFVLALELFDWDPVDLRAIPAAAVPATLRWSLHLPDPDDLDQPGRAFDPSWVVRGEPTITDGALVEHLEAHGGRAFLVVERAGCSPSIVPIRQLPGYATRDAELVTLRIRVPTCAATLADTIAIPAGPFIYGGLGEPPSPVLVAHPSELPEVTLDLPTLRIDRTEVSNAAFDVFAEMEPITGIAKPAYPASPSLIGIAAPRSPVSGVDWFEARAFCQFLGKELPSSQQWTKALRGGLVLPDGSLNPMPRRNLPWGSPVDPVPARISRTAKSTVGEIGMQPGDRSVYGVLDLAGNVNEWTETSSDPGFRVVRGGNWLETKPDELVDFNAIENFRSSRQRQFALGVRCVQDDAEVGNQTTERSSQAKI